MATDDTDARVWQALFEFSPAAQWVFDRETLRFLAVNDAALRRYGYARDEFLALGLADIRPPDQLDRLAQRVAQSDEALARPSRWTHRLRDGRLVEVEVRSHPVVFRGRPARLAHVVDLSDRAAAEHAARESEARLRFALDAAGLGEWSMDLRTNVAQRSLQHDRCFGYTEPVAHWGYDTFLAHVHPLDRDRVDACYQQAMQSRGDYDVEFRVVWPDGQVRWLWSKGRFYADLDGSLARVAGIQVDVTARRDGQAALVRSERRLRLLFDNSVQGILATRPDGSVEAANPAACAALGQPEAEVVRRRREDLMDVEDPRYAPLLEERRRHGSAHGKVRMRRGDGTLFEAEVSSTIYHDEGGQALSTLMFQDITPRLQAERLLHEQVRRLDLLRDITRAVAAQLRLLPMLDVVATALHQRMPVDAVVVATLGDGDALSVRAVRGEGPAPRALAAWLQGAAGAAAPAALRACLAGHVLHEPDLSAAPDARMASIAGVGLRSLVTVPLMRQQLCTGLLLVARADASAFHSGDCEFLHQVAEHTALAAQQIGLRDDLERAYAELQTSQHALLHQERLGAIGQMAGGIAHNINNAIMPMALYAEALLSTEQGLSETGRAWVRTIQRSVQDVTQLVAGLRDYARPGPPSAPAATDVNEVVREVVALTRARWHDMPQQDGITVRLLTELQDELPPVAVSAAELRAALANVVLNAVDALPGGGLIRVLTRASRHESGPPRVEVVVADDGIGMDAQTLATCMEPFVSTKGERGTGLGLAMVLGSLQRYGGTVVIDSLPGQGTTVTLSMPAALRAAEGPAAPEAAPGAAGDAPRADPDPDERDAAAAPAPPRLRLLLVDDDDLVLDSLTMIVEREGHAVTCARGGAAALECLAGPQPFDAVVTDLGMPGVDGRQVAAAAKARADAPFVIMLTGWGRRMLEEDGPPPGVDLLLGKPPRIADLRTALQRVGRRD